MKNKSYHHGDLRRALIETGIELIGQEGEEKLSLRKVAVKCGVSNAAPYAHFRNKDEYIFAMQKYILDLFTASLEKTVAEYANDPSLLPMLGKTYVMFFYQNPLYYNFLFSRKNASIKLSLNHFDETENPPFAILQKTATSVFRKAKLSENMIQDKIIAMWSLVHGLSSIITMIDIDCIDDLEIKIVEIIKSISVSYPFRQENE